LKGRTTAKRSGGKQLGKNSNKEEKKRLEGGEGGGMKRGEGG